jgi:hypothetical protein
MKRNHLLLSVVALLICSAFFFSPASKKHSDVSQESGNCGCLEPVRVSLTHRIEHLEDQVSNIQTNGLAVLKNPQHGYLNVAFLWWRGQGNQWETNFQETILNSTTTLTKIDRGKVRWTPGCRCEIGFATPFHWNVGGQWTYYHNKSTSNSSNPQGVIQYFFDLSGTELRCASIMNYNTLDLDFSTNCRLVQYVNLSPFLSVRCLLLKNGYRDRLYGNIPPTSQGLAPDATLVLRHHFWGLGPKVGASTSLRFGKSGIEMVGTLSGSLLYGKASMKERGVQSVSVDGGGVQDGPATITEFRERFSDMKASLQLAFGLFWRQEFGHGKNAISLRALWETNYWWDQNNFSVFNSQGNRVTNEDLILSGVNVGLGFEF